MRTIHTMCVGTYGVNCTIIVDGNRAIIVDPGQDADEIARFLADRKLVPELIMLTHAHFDHIGGIPRLQGIFPSLPVYAHPKDWQYLGHPMNAAPPDYPPIQKPKNLRDCRELDGDNLLVLLTPGHTPGGVVYYLPAEKTMLTGDTLFAGSVGRTDFPGGDAAALHRSLLQLAEHPDDVRIIPGHGSGSTLGAEKRGNPFMSF